MYDKTMSATQASLDRMERSIRWYADYRGSLFKLILTAFLGALTLYYGVGTSTTNINVSNVLRMLPWAMFWGTLLVMAVDSLLLWRQRRMIDDAYDAEEKTGTEINSFQYLKHGLLLELRFQMCYGFGLVLAVVILIHDQNLIAKFL